MAVKAFYLHQQSLSNELLLKKSYAQEVYTKFLVFKTAIGLKKNIFLLDNFLTEFTIKLKKKYRHLHYFLKLKPGNFYKGNIFVYKHSKLSFFYFTSVGLKVQIKKSIFNGVRAIRELFCARSCTFFFKVLRGGFLGFSNGVCGFLSKSLLLKSKELFLKGKKYCIFFNIVIQSYSTSKLKSFFLFFPGFIRNFRIGGRTRKHVFFKRFKFRFTFLSACIRVLSRRLLFFKNLLSFQKFGNYYINLLLKLCKFFI